MDSNVFNDVWQFALRLYVLNVLMDQNIFDNFLPVGSRADVYKFWWRSSDKRSIGGVQKNMLFRQVWTVFPFIFGRLNLSRFLGLRWKWIFFIFFLPGIWSKGICFKKKKYLIGQSY